MTAGEATLSRNNDLDTPEEIAEHVEAYLTTNGDPRTLRAGGKGMLVYLTIHHIYLLNIGGYVSKPRSSPGER